MKMKEEKRLRLTIGALLHDFGKVIYRAGEDSNRHALSGAAYLSSERVGMTDREVLACVKYHHASDLRQAKLEKDALAYIVYMADNIASAADRREQEETKAVGKGFDRTKPMDSIFNLLHGNHGEMSYSPHRTNVEKEINYPAAEQVPFGTSDYQAILRNLTENMRGMEWSQSYLHSLMDALEANLSFVPSSTNKMEVADISLYDHLKLTAAFAAGIEARLAEQGESDYCRRLFTDGKEFYKEKAFLLAVLDLSGIQKFIYTITSKGALKTLRARSFYLDFLMEHIADELLERLELTRANLLYSGGGRVNLLLANTEKTRHRLREFQRQVNAWCQQYFDISLYMAVSWAECSSDDLQDNPGGSYAGLYRTLSKGLSDNKVQRYTAEEILSLNEKAIEEDARECKACRHSGRVNEDALCPICAAMQRLSAHIMESAYEFFAALPETDEQHLPLPGGYVLAAGSEREVREWQQRDMLRLYGKNRFYTGKAITARLWIGDYHTGETFEELAKCDKGIHRLGVLRSDVDNLGLAFAMGFQRPDGDRRYVTLSRTAELSRQLSMFFKLHIRKIMAQPNFTLTGQKKDCRHAAIVYSGGDDLFVVGAWDDIIEFAVDLRNAFSRYGENTLTLSAGIGIYPASYPISVMARETAAMEEKSKLYPGKNAVTLFEDGSSHSVQDASGKMLSISDGTYAWETLEQQVLGEKFRTMEDFFNASDRGKSFLYKILELLRNRSDRISFARYIYLLSRMEPEDTKENKEAVEHYRAFAAKMRRWYQNEEDVRHLKTAIQIYAYLTRGTEAEHETAGLRS